MQPKADRRKSGDSRNGDDSSSSSANFQSISDTQFEKKMSSPSLHSIPMPKKLISKIVPRSGSIPPSSNTNQQGNNSGSPQGHVFLTSQGTLYNNPNGKHLESFPKVQEAYGQLNNLVEFLEEKVDGVIERHEAEFLLAYKNQMTRVKKELSEMKSLMDEQDKRLKAGDRLDTMQKQLVWFRDESLKLYNKLQDKDKQVADLKQIIADQKKELSFSENQIIALKKKLRIAANKVALASATKTLLNDQGLSASFQDNPLQNWPQISPTHRAQSSQAAQIQISQLGLEGAGQRHPFSLDQNNWLGGVAEQNETVEDEETNEQKKKGNHQGELISNMVIKSQGDLASLQKEIVLLLRTEDEKRLRQIKNLQNRLTKVIKEKTTQSVVRSDLENFFLECVETVRKQIIKRKPPTKSTHINFYLNQIKDYSLFRTEDKIKILELLLSNEKLMMFIYQKIFPQNSSKQIDNINASLNIAAAYPELEYDNHKNSFDLQDQRQNYKQDEDSLSIFQLVDQVGQQKLTSLEKPRTSGTSRPPYSAQEKNSLRPRILSQQVPRRANKHQEHSMEVSFDEGKFIRGQITPSNYISTSISQNPQLTSGQFDKRQSEIHTSIQSELSTKQKLECLINSDFSSMNKSNRIPFRSKMGSYKVN